MGCPWLQRLLAPYGCDLPSSAGCGSVCATFSRGPGGLGSLGSLGTTGGGPRAWRAESLICSLASIGVLGRSLNLLYTRTRVRKLVSCHKSPPASCATETTDSTIGACWWHWSYETAYPDQGAAATAGGRQLLSPPMFWTAHRFRLIRPRVVSGGLAC